MDNLNFTFQSLFYRNMGTVPVYLRKFRDPVEFLDEPFSGITAQVIRLLTGELDTCESCCRKDSYIEAQVLIGRESYTVRVTFKDGVSMFYVTDSEHSDRTMWYLETVTQSDEGQFSRFLSPGGYPARLFPLDDPDNMGNSRIFRDYLRQFAPQQLVPDKDYWLRLEPDGRLIVRLGQDGQEIPDLSETESRIYHYLCFLQRIHFWDSCHALRDYQAVQFPILVRDFSAKLDQRVDIYTLYDKAEALGRQQLIIK